MMLAGGGLSALHGGALAVRGGECGDALALAVSLKLLPHGTLGAASVACGSHAKAW